MAGAIFIVDNLGVMPMGIIKVPFWGKMGKNKKPII